VREIAEQYPEHVRVEPAGATSEPNPGK
jgi:hypothetical protein